jgi:cytochrome P450
VKKELEEADDDFNVDYIHSMKYTELFIYEIFRIYYNGIPNGRYLEKSHVFSGYKLEKGEFVAHTFVSKGAFEVTEDFEKIDLSEKVRKNNFIFTPFGAGTHPCLGKAFAISEVKTVLILLYKHLKLVNKNKNIKLSDMVDWKRPLDGEAIFCQK